MKEGGGREGEGEREGGWDYGDTGGVDIHDAVVGLGGGERELGREGGWWGGARGCEGRGVRCVCFLFFVFVFAVLWKWVETLRERARTGGARRHGARCLARRVFAQRPLGVVAAAT